MKQVLKVSIGDDMAKKKVISRRRVKKLKLDDLYAKLERTIKKHGKVKIFFTTSNESNINDRMRKIYANGYCEVTYNEHWRDNQRYNRFGKQFQTSCFFEDYMCSVAKRFKNQNRSTIKLNLKEVLKSMRKHDGTWLKIAEVRYGKYYKSKMRL